MLKLKNLDKQDTYSLVISLEIISQEIALLSQKLVVNYTKFKLFSQKKRFPDLLPLQEEQKKLKVELTRLNNYFSEIISLLNEKK